MKKILFVDDNQLLAQIGCDILRMRGYRAVPAYNGEHALQEFEKQDFDVVVTDYRMEGMNGLELASEIHRKQPGLPIIMVTGFEPIQSDECLACLEKDNLFPALLEAIDECLAPAQAR